MFHKFDNGGVLLMTHLCADADVKTVFFLDYMEWLVRARYRMPTIIAGKEGESSILVLSHELQLNKITR